MRILLRTPGGDVTARLPVEVVPRGGTYLLEDGDGVTHALEDLSEGDVLSGHMPEGDGFEDDAVFAVARREGALMLVRARGELDLDPAKGWPRMLAFSPWSAVVRQGDRVLESWSEETREDALATARERAAELSAEYGRFAPPTTFDAVSVARMPAADIQPATGPSPR